MCRRDIPDVHNSNILPLVYTLELNFNLNEFDPAYPKEPQSLEERIRKTRMDRNLLQRELAEQIGVTKETVANWEKGRTMSFGKSRERLREFLKGMIGSPPEAV